MSAWIGVLPLHLSGRLVVLAIATHELSRQTRDSGKYAERDGGAFDLAATVQVD
jgi:hypothetical protein